MYAAEFDYVACTSLDEAIALLDHHGDDAKVLAGGQSLVPMLNLRLIRPALLVDINPLPLDEISIDTADIVVPAGTRFHQIANHPLVLQHAPALAEAARLIGNVRVRTLGTIGGSVAHADPAAELPCVLTALGASITAVGPRGMRSIRCADFFVTYLTTALAPAEIVTEVRLPALPDRGGQAFVEFARRANDFAVVEAAAAVEVDRRGRYYDVSLVIGGAQDKPLQLGGVVGPLLAGQQPSPTTTAEAARHVRARVRPHTDVHATAAYRSQLVEVLARRALEVATERARGGQG